MARVLVPLAPGCEELEAVTVIDLLRRARIEVVTAGLAPGPVQGSRGTVLLPDSTLDAALQQDYDMIVLPGGQPGATNLEQDTRILALLKKMAAAGKMTPRTPLVNTATPETAAARMIHLSADARYLYPA